MPSVVGTLVPPNLSAAPTSPSPVKGQIYFDTATNTLYWYNGTAWVSASGGTPPDATTSSKGVVQLAGDLTGTAASPQIAANAVGASELADGSVDFAAFASPALASGRAFGTFTYSAADSNGRGYGVGKTTSWERGATLFHSTLVQLVAPATGYYWIMFNLDNFSAGTNSGVGMYGFLNGSTTTAEGASAYLQKPTSPAAVNGINASWVMQLNASDNLSLFSWESLGGTARFVMTVIRLPL